LLFVLLGAGCFLGYQFYTFTERIHDPIDNENKIVFLKYSYGREIFQLNFSLHTKNRKEISKGDG